MLSEYATAARAEEVWAGGTVEIAGARSGPATGTEPAGIELAGIEPAGIEPAGIEPAGIEPAGIEPAGDAAADSRLAGWLEPLTSTWDRKALLALLVPALILLVVALV